jgi:tellurite resistance protein
LEQAEMINRLAYDQWCEKRREQAVGRVYSHESLEAAAKDKLPGFSKEYPYLKRFSTSEKLREAVRIIEREICSDLQLPSFDQWSEMDDYKNVQVALF